jgi:hypothetical protein
MSVGKINSEYTTAGFLTSSEPVEIIFNPQIIERSTM